MVERPLAGDGSVPGLYLDAPIVLSYGFGVDSTAVIGLCVRHGIKIKAIIFADPGDEHDETYAYYRIISAYLERQGLPPITVVRYRAKKFKYGVYLTLWENCIRNRTLPSIAFFFMKGCSLKWKGKVIDKWVSEQTWAKQAFQQGLRVQRLIGFDCSAQDNKRFFNAQKSEARKAAKGKDDKRWSWIYPLQAWGLSRVDCIKFIETEMGIAAPHKSSCFYCSSMKPEEVAKLPQRRLEQIVLMEEIARPNLTKIKGLWQMKRMTDFIVQQNLLPKERLEVLLQRPNEEVKQYLMDKRYDTK